MSDAKMACMFVQSTAKQQFPDDAIRMENVVLGWLTSFADIKGSGTHKYIPADRLTADIGADAGSGVYRYVEFHDGSYLLNTCKHGVAVWEGGDNKAFIPERK